MADHKSSLLDGGDSRSLAQQINAAITSSHTKINRLILDRMPRAVPPQADNPSKYITGLLHFGAVYTAFESLWQDLLGIHSEIAPVPYTYPFNNDPSPHAEIPQITDRTRHVLEAAYWPTMLRAARIKADIQAMTGWPGHVVDEQITSVGTSGRLGKVLLQTQESVNAKPHLLLAYAYCFYMALLSGGSYIRTELMYIKSDFWHATPTPVKPNMIECTKEPSLEETDRSSSPGTESPVTGFDRHDFLEKLPLAFLDFDPPLGENPRQQTKQLKAEFKRRFAEAAQSLTDPEQKDIVKESIHIFHSMEAIVAQLDKTCGSSQWKDHMHKTGQPPPLSSRSTHLGSRLRDSIAIAKGRLLRTRRRSSGASVTVTVPTAFEEGATDRSQSGSSKPSSVSDSSGEFRDIDRPLRHESPLARDAVLPGDGFRTIRYSNDLPHPDRSSRLSSADAEKGASAHPRGMDGVNDDIECCPIFRGTNAVAQAVPTKAEGPNYALYAVISNFVMFVGVAMVFAAYLYVRHGDSRADGAPLGL